MLKHRVSQIRVFIFFSFLFIFSYSTQTTLSIQLQYDTSSLKWNDLIFRLLFVDLPGSAANVKTQVDDSGLRNLPKPTRNGLFSALFRMDPLSFQLHPAGNHTGLWKQYSGRIPSYPETEKSGKFPVPNSIRKQEESERETSRKSTFPFGTWPEKFVSQPDVS